MSKDGYEPLSAGDRLVAGLGLTSARWQILDAIASAEHPQPVAWLARDMGANRQNGSAALTTCTNKASSRSRTPPS